jgi:hypothetical protein
MRILRAALGSRVHFLSILLVDESDCDVLGFGEQCWVLVLDDLVARGTEDKAIEVDALCLAPAIAGFEYSQDRIAKKKAPITKSAATAGAVSRRDK